VLSRDGKRFKDDVFKCASLFKKKLATFNSKTDYLSVNYLFMNDFLTKGGAYKQNSDDLDNFIKLFQDAMFDGLGLNDSNVLEMQAFKRHGKAGIVATIEVKKLTELVPAYDLEL